MLKLAPHDPIREFLGLPPLVGLAGLLETLHLTEDLCFERLGLLRFLGLLLYLDHLKKEEEEEKERRRRSGLGLGLGLVLVAE